MIWDIQAVASLQNHQQHVLTLPLLWSLPFSPTEDVIFGLEVEEYTIYIFLVNISALLSSFKSFTF